MMAFVPLFWGVPAGGRVAASKPLLLSPRRRSLAVLLVLAVVATPLPALAPHAYPANPAKSTVRFRAATGLPLMPTIQGRIERFDFRGAIDAAEPSASHALIVIDTRGIRSESRLVPDSAIQARLQTAQYPTATLRIVAVRPVAQGYDADVELDFMGQTYQDTVRTEAIPFERY